MSLTRRTLISFIPVAVLFPTVKKRIEPNFTFRFVDQFGNLVLSGKFEMEPFDDNGHQGWRNKIPLFFDYNKRLTTWMPFNLEVYRDGVLQHTFYISTFHPDEPLYKLCLKHDCIRINHQGEVIHSIVGHAVRTKNGTNLGNMFTKIELHKPRPVI